MRQRNGTSPHADREPPIAPRKRFLTFLPILGGIILGDLLSKALVFAAAGAEIVNGRLLSLRPPIAVIPGFFELQCVMNQGAFSGWFSVWSGFLVVVSITALVAIVAYVAVGNVTRGLFVVSLAFIAGGTAGNLFDRAVYGAVRDFFHFFISRGGGERLSWPNFNVADMSICIGVGLWILIELTDRRRYRS